MHSEGVFLVFEVQKNAPKLHQSVTRPYWGGFCGEVFMHFPLTHHCFFTLILVKHWEYT